MFKVPTIMPIINDLRSAGVRVGNWLSVRQAQALLNAPDATNGRPRDCAAGYPSAFLG